MKSILITGCSSGIGYDAAHTLNNRGWRVFATCRQETDCARLRAEGLESFVLDYEDEQSIKDAVAETFERTGGTLDALFNNGAYAIPGVVEDIPRDAFRAIFEANVFGYFDLIQQVLPAMRAQGHGRIINCSSVLGFIGLPARSPYISTKFALEGLTDVLRIEHKRINSPIDVILIQPGPITTEIRQNSAKQFEKWIDWENSAHRKIYEKAIIPRLYAEGGEPDWGELPSSAVTDQLIHALEAKRPREKYMVTKVTYLMAALRRLLPVRYLDKLLMG
ncbi:MAG: SDR family NAD(P)-dependent oxidoreductase [Pseudomonadota bacterium]